MLTGTNRKRAITQKELDTMIEYRKQGITGVVIADIMGIKENVIYKYTKGVVPSKNLISRKKIKEKVIKLIEAGCDIETTCRIANTSLYNVEKIIFLTGIKAKNIQKNKTERDLEIEKAKIETIKRKLLQEKYFAEQLEDEKRILKERYKRRSI